MSWLATAGRSSIGCVSMRPIGFATTRRARAVVKGSRWLLLRNYENINKQDDRVRLQELLAANKKLATVYILKDDLKHLWDYHYPGAALRFWKEWYAGPFEAGSRPW